MQMYMPYRRSPPPAIVSREGAEEAAEGKIGLREARVFLRRSVLTIVGSAIALGALGLAYIILVPPTYKATAQVMVDDRKGSHVFNEPTPASEAITDQARVESQIELIRSGDLAESVIDKLQLAKLPEFSPAERTPADSWSIAAPLLAAKDWLQQWTFQPSIDASESGRLRLQEIFASRLFVRRVGQSMVIEVGFRSHDPVLAARVANAIVDAYRQRDVDAKSDVAKREREWLSKRLKELEQQSYSARLASEQFKRTRYRADQGYSQSRLQELQTVSDSQRHMYDEYLRKLNETSQRVSFPEPDSKLVATAAVPLRPSPPQSLILSLAVALGGALGLAISGAKAASDRRVRTPNQIITHAGIDCLGTVSGLPANRMMGFLRKSSSTALAHLNYRRIHPTLRVVVDQPRASFAKDLRAIKTFINNSADDPGPRTIGVVAPRKGQGTTTIASNLALLYAMAGERTLLVDACTDHPVISGAFGSPSQVGLMDAIQDPQALADILDDEREQSFTVLPIGRAGSLVTLADRIASRTTDFQIRDLKRKFGVVIIDLPAISTSPDALAIAPHLDGILMVVTPNGASLDELAHCARSLDNARGSMLGVVINRWAPRLAD